MNIQLFSGLDGAEKAKGTVVIIDVFRAATVEAYLLGQGASLVYPVATKEEAFALKSQHSDYVLIGEEGAVKINGFDYGNSPFEISKAQVEGKIIVHRTSSGTQGLVHAKNADEIIFGSFVTHNAIKTYILSKKPELVSLVAMDGENGEDWEFAKYLKNELLGKENNMEEIIKQLRITRSWYLNPEFHQYPEEDFSLCLELDKFPFICLVEEEKDNLVTKKHDVQL